MATSQDLEVLNLSSALGGLSPGAQLSLASWLVTDAARGDMEGQSPRPASHTQGFVFL